MKPNVAATATASAPPCAPETQRTVPELVADLYDAAPPVERVRLVKHLLNPLGVLSLVAVADGIFAKIRFRSGWDLQVRLEDLQNVRAAHVTALVDHAQQVSIEAIDGLAQLMLASPTLSGTAAAAMLVTALVNRARQRKASDGRDDETPSVPD